MTIKGRHSVRNALIFAAMLTLLFSSAVAAELSIIGEVEQGIDDELQFYISWTTESLAMSRVTYRAESGNDFETETFTALDAHHLHVLTGVEPGTTYTYQIHLSDWWGGTATFEGSFVTPALASPEALQVRTDDGLVEMRWAATFGATDYVVERAATTAGPFESLAEVTGTTYLDTDVDNDVTYAYRITAVRGDTVAAPSPIVEVTVKPVGVKYLWLMEDPNEVATYRNDNRGATFALTNEHAYQGSQSVAITPSGSSDESTLELDLTGERILTWNEGTHVSVNIYLPAANEVLPNTFFLGMANTTDGWSWVDGTFSDTSLASGWNEIVFELPDAMRNLNADGSYILYFTFFYRDDAGYIPLREPIYIDGFGVFADVFAETAETITRADLLTQVSPEVHAEVEALLTATDNAGILDVLSRKAFDYFWHEANESNGLIRDRSTKDSPASIAAVGFALSAYPIAVERGWVEESQAYQRTLTTLRTFTDGGVAGERGFFYHFVDMDTGERYGNSELSSIDTALFLAGALTAGQFFADTEVEALAEALYVAAEWDWMMAGGETPSMGWTPEGGFLPHRWETFDEGLLLYVLAIGSPSHPITESTWDVMKRPEIDGRIVLPQEPLFVYQYPLAWLDLRIRTDAYTNYWENAIAAAQHNFEFTKARADMHEAYGDTIWGLSASDGPRGYRAYGASPGNHDGTIAPYASVASMPLVPELAMSSIRGMLDTYGPLIWGEYGFVSAFNPDVEWYSDQFIGIDQGITLLMLENTRSELIWNLFMNREEVQQALKRIGFES